uniref:Tubulin/FtsZ 2-layer sandwich domain-containing protein n=1 Tax=Parascaris univalens TaxID=6257 RepID=A0A914ZZ04_PARUN
MRPSFQPRKHITSHFRSLTSHARVSRLAVIWLSAIHKWQMHDALQGRCGAKRRQLCYRRNQIQAIGPVCRLVPHRIQGGYQLSAASCSSRRRLGESTEGGMHASQHNESPRLG